MNYQDINDKFNNVENYQKNANINNLQQNMIMSNNNFIK